MPSSYTFKIAGGHYIKTLLFNILYKNTIAFSTVLFQLSIYKVKCFCVLCSSVLSNSLMMQTSLNLPKYIFIKLKHTNVINDLRIKAYEFNKIYLYYKVHLRRRQSYLGHPVLKSIACCSRN